METRVRDGPKELDMLSWMGRTALELVGQGGLGHSFDPLTDDSQDEFTESIKAFSYVSLAPIIPARSPDTRLYISSHDSVERVSLW